MNTARFSEVRSLLKLGTPVIISQLLIMSTTFVDTVMAGNYGATDLAAVAIGFSLFTPVFTLGTGTLMALSPIVAHDFGGRRFEHIGRNVRQTLWLSIFLAIPAILIVRLLHPITGIMGMEHEVQDITRRYLLAISWGIVPVFAFMTLRYFNEGLGATGPAMFVSVIGLFFNILANYTLIYGNWGFPELGGEGAGWASAIVFWAMFLALLVYTAGRKAYKRFRIFTATRGPSRKLMFELVKLGFPIGLSSTMEVTLFAVTALLMGALGTAAVAGHQIALNFAALTFMIPFGLSTAITVRVGQNAGRGALAKARFSGFTGIGVSAIIMAVSAIAIFTFAKSIASIYTDNPEVLQMATGLLYMAAIFQVSDGLQVSAYGALRGMKDTRIPMYVNLLAYWIIGLPSGYILGFTLEMGPQCLWIGLIVGLSIAAILHNVRFRRITRE